MTAIRNSLLTDNLGLSPFLIHLTKNTETHDHFSAFDNLVNILKTGEIWASDKKKGFIKGANGASCFMDVPFMHKEQIRYYTDPISSREGH